MAVTVSSRRKLMGVVAGVLIVAAGVVITRSLSQGQGRAASPQAYYTVDDGVTLFSDKVELLAPFDHKGQEAVRARVFSCDGNKTRFVGYLEKFDPEVLKQRSEAMARGESPLGYNAGPFVKKAGAQYTRWVSEKDGQEYREAITVTPPAGSGGGMEEVTP